MTSTEFNIGLGGTGKNSSRVLKPPGGGHSNIFGEAEVKHVNPRPKYDQQNSSNLNFCMNTADPCLKPDARLQEAPAPAAVPPPSVEQPAAAPVAVPEPSKPASAAAPAPSKPAPVAAAQAQAPAQNGK